ncbi:MAG: lipopolysaccharide assembly protein LapA domain-containing protein [Solirubrobacterales bacterium]
MATRSRAGDLESAGKPRRKITLAQIGFLIALALMIVFAVVNLDKVRVNWIFGTWNTPLILALAVAFVLGAGAGALAVRQRGARKRKAQTR